MGSTEPAGTMLDAGAPLVELRHPIGRRSAVLTDPAREQRAVPVECWYPAAAATGERAVTEILPGIGFRAAAVADAPPLGDPTPVVVWSHGRTGTRSAYTLLCEGLAASGYTVLAPDHQGDTLMDWMLGAASDDDTNGTNRVADVHHVLDAAFGGHAVTAGIALDAERVAVAGHSYGGWTALAAAGADERHPRVRAVAGLQSLTRSLPRTVLERVDIPTLLIVGSKDATTPPALDADRAAHLLRTNPQALRIDIEAAAHQACSDVGLYLELAPQVPGLPDLVVQYVQSMAEGITGTAGDPWRPTVGLHVELLVNWLDHALGRETTAARTLAALVEQPGVELRLGALAT